MLAYFFKNSNTSSFEIFFESSRFTQVLLYMNAKNNKMQMVKMDNLVDFKHQMKPIYRDLQVIEVDN